MTTADAIAIATLRSLVIPPRRCRACGAQLPDHVGPGRPRVWCDEHSTAVGRRPAGRVCLVCGACLDGRRRQTIVCRPRCASRLKRQRARARLGEASHPLRPRARQGADVPR